MTAATAHHAAPGAADGLTRHPLWPHQAEAFRRAQAQRAFMLAHSMGAGKSLTVLALLEDDRAGLQSFNTLADPAPYRVLVLAPKSVVGVWPDQIHEHAVSDWRVWSGDVTGRHGKLLRNPSVARRAEALIQATSDAAKLRRPFMAVVNYEAAWPGDMGRLLVGTPWDAVILDESHRIKSPSGKASRQAARITERVRQRGGRVLALTGTPMPHSPLDLWAQLRALDGGRRLGTSYHRFCVAYGAGEQIWAAGPDGPVQRTIYKGLRPDRLEQFTQLVGPLMHQVSEDELNVRLGLPDTIDVHRTIDLDPSTRRVYDDLEKDLISRVDDGAITAANAMVLVLRLAQVASGYAPATSLGGVTGAARRLSDGPLPEKARLLADVLEDLPVREPVVVFCRFHHDLDAVRAVAEQQGRVYGELSGRDRGGLTAQARMNPDIDVLGAQIKSGGVGIDLTRARYGIYYTLGFELADYLQSRKRLHRPGQERPVVYTHLLASNTIEHAIYGALRQRQQVVDTVLHYLKGAAR